MTPFSRPYGERSSTFNQRSNSEDDAAQIDHGSPGTHNYTVRSPWLVVSNSCCQPPEFRIFEFLFCCRSKSSVVVKPAARDGIWCSMREVYCLKSSIPIRSVTCCFYTSLLYRDLDVDLDVDLDMFLLLLNRISRRRFLHVCSAAMERD